ncbi:MAG: cytochrome b [Candidatus Aquirickettsiella gammari]|uniref:Cytochrome b n=1 Tax=Candidatus Aquirickettsiella gammari TaxID=2016198 RepID=A0A370CJ43_9COXI|nr:MAG: cytochrome b [Candidatus Aquirickettsiella gammari]
MMKNTRNTYGQIAKCFHWLMAFLIIGMYLVAYMMINISPSHFRDSLYNFHKATGLLLLGLVALRLWWRVFNVQPTLPASISIWQRHAANWNIVGLYILMFAMPITGFLSSTLANHAITFYGLFTILPLANNHTASRFFSKSHEIASYLLIMFFALHVIGAFYHHFFLKDDVLIRMRLRFKNNSRVNNK